MNERLLQLFGSVVSVVAADAAVNVDIAVASEALVKVDQQIYEVEYDDIDFMEVVPVVDLNDPIAETFRYYYVEKAGRSELGKENGPINYVDAMIKAKDISLHSGNVGYKYGIKELERATALKRPLDPLKAQTAMETTLETAQEICYHGDDARGISGFFNNDAVAVIARKTAGLHTTLTALEIVNEVNHMFSTAYIQSRKKQFKKKAKSNRLMLTSELWAYMATTPISEQNPNTTILDFLVKKCPWLTSEEQVIDSVHLEAGTMRATQYDKKKVCFVWGHKLRWMPPQRDDLSVKRVGDYSVGGTVIKEDLAVVEKKGF